MAGDWLKIETNLPEKREVMAITAAMGWTDPDMTVGKLFKLWRWFDQQTLNGDAPSVTLALLDLIIGVTGFCRCVVDVGWMVETSAGVALPNFDRHNGKTAKTRALGARRNINYRSSDAKSDAHTVTNVTPAPSPREEKRSIDINTGEGDSSEAVQRAPSARFKKPSVEELQLQAAKIGLESGEVQKFINHYESNGWRVGKNPMKSWPAALNNWKLRRNEHGNTNNHTGRDVDRNKGTWNEGKADQYAHVGIAT